MQRLSQHILSLLRLYDSVALPGVGFFYLDYISARYDSESSLFFPPFYSVSFEISYLAEDNLLADSYARCENITRPQAQKIVKEDVNRFLDLLDENKEIILDGLGSFVYQNDEIDFYPSLSLDIGLPTFKVDPIRPLSFVSSAESPASPVPEPLDEVRQNEVPQLEEPEVEEPKVEEPKVEEPEVEVPQEEMPPVAVGEESLPSEEAADNISPETQDQNPSFIPSEESETEMWKNKNKIPEGYHYHKPGYFYLPIHKYFANIAASIILVVVVGLSAVLLAGSSCNQSGTASIVPISVSDKDKGKSQVASDSLASPSRDDAAITHKAGVEPEKKEEPKKENNFQRPLLATNDDGEVVPGANSLPTSPYLQEEDGVAKFYAVIAAFRSQKEVETFMDQHKEDRQKYKIIRNKKVSLVTVSSSNDRKELENQIPLIRVDYPNAWIFTMK